MIGLFAAATAGLLLQAAAAAPSSALRPPSSSQLGVQVQPASVTVRQLSYAQLDGSRNGATLVTPVDFAQDRPFDFAQGRPFDFAQDRPFDFAQGRPADAAPGGAGGRGPRPAVLFLHWYEPPRPTSNRTEFLAEAVDLAQSGVVSLLVDTPWSAGSWFPKRDAAHDYELTQAMTKNVRRALDVLLAQPGIDTTRVALVGHDFGAMWGALAAAEDPRVTHFVYMAGTRSFTDWYLFTPKKEGAERDAFVAKMAPLDPIVALGRISPRPVLLQFGTKDQFVKNEAAQAMADAVTGPKTFKTYEFEHELTWQARVDRLAWLREQFRLTPH